jgi:5-methylthioadenosine/S-adenosylhomocysteine deaminase
LDEIGFLSNRTVAAHGIFTDEQDQQILLKRGVNIVHCPLVFAKGGMIAPFYPYVSKGINVAMGSDSYAGDMMAEMRMAAFLGKIQTGNAHQVTSTDVLFAATVGGAVAFKDPTLGRIAEGQKADMIIIDMDKPHILPIAAPVINLVYHANASDITHVLVDGRVVKDSQGMTSVDTERVMFESKRVADKMWSLARQEGIL